MIEKTHPDPSGPSMTKRVPEGLTNINRIVDRIYKTGQVPPTRPDAQYGDVSNIPPLHEAMNAKTRAEKFVRENPPRKQTTEGNKPPGSVQVTPEAEKTPPQNTPSKPPSKEEPKA